METILRALYTRLRDEPVLTAAFVSAVLLLFVQLGLPITEGQAAAVSGVVLAASAFLARRKVEPLAKASRQR